MIEHRNTRVHQVISTCLNEVILLPRLNISTQMSIKRLTLDRHIHLIEGILQHIVRVELIHLPYDDIHIRLMGFREEEELGASQRLKALKTKMLALQKLESRRRDARGAKWIETSCDGVNTVEMYISIRKKDDS